MGRVLFGSINNLRNGSLLNTVVELLQNFKKNLQISTQEHIAHQLANIHNLFVAGIKSIFPFLTKYGNGTFTDLIVVNFSIVSSILENDDGE